MAEPAAFLAGVRRASEATTLNSALIYAVSGRGKTTLAASASASGKKTLIVDIEGSASGVGRLYPDVDVITIPNDGSGKPFEYIELIRHDLLYKEHPYEVVIFDTMNVAQEFAKRFFSELPQNRNNKFGVWDDLKSWTVEFMRDFHAAPFLAIFLFHPQTEKDERTGALTTTVSIQGKAQEIAPTIPDLVGYLDFENIEGELHRVLYIGESDSLVTKNRFGLPSRIVDPTFNEIFEELEKSVKTT